MVNPVTGPVVVDRSNNLDGPGSRRVYRARYTQKPPYNLDLRFRGVHWKVLSASGKQLIDNKYVSITGNANTNKGYSPWQMFTYACDDNSQEVIDAVQLARARFSSAVSEQAQVLVNLAERAQTKAMVADRCVSLYQAYRAFRKGNFRQARKHLGASKKLTPNPRNSAKKAGDGWLEWHFGWSPLFGDIHRGMEILTSPIPTLTAVGRGTRVNNWTYTGGVATFTNKAWHNVIAKATVRADLQIQNKNLWMANQLGLLNPAAVAWELVPFSFLIDWVGNVGAVLNQYREFDGLTLIRPLTSWKATVSSTCHYKDVYQGKVVKEWLTSSQCVAADRKVGIPAVRLRFQMPDRLSWQRGLTAIALLTGLLAR